MKISILMTFMMLTACGSQYVVKQDAPGLAEGEGYLGFSIHSLDKLYNVQMKHVEKNKSFYIGTADVGHNLYVLNLAAGEYCLLGFDAYNLRVDFEDQGFCTYVEAGEMNYFKYFQIRNPVTTAFSFFDDFVISLNKKYPKICAQYIGEPCKS